MCEKIEARFVRGNAFKFQIEVIAYTETGRRVENFELGEAVLKFGTKTPLTVKTYEVVEGTTILVSFDGSQSLGIYGMEMTGTYEGEAWRWAYRKVFQIVETNEAAHLPESCVVLKDTLFMTAEVVMGGGGSSEQVQADWLESDPESPAFIKNKPNLSNYLTSAYEVITALVTLDSSGKYTFNSPQYNALFAAWNTGKIPVLRLKDATSVQERIIANMPMFLGGKDGLTSFFGIEQTGDTQYVFAYVGSLSHTSSSYAKVIDVQEEIEDLDTIRSNAATGATALQEAYEVVTALVTLDSETGKYTFSSPQYNILMSAWNTGKIPILRLKDSSSVQEKIIANMPMFLGGKDGLTSFYGVEQQGNTKYVFAYVGSLQQAANSYAKVVDIQEAIQDLDTIRSGAAAGATALQEAYVVIDGGTKTKTGDQYNFTNSTITAINTAWTAGKVPVLTATLSDDNVKFVAVISKNADNKFFGEFFVGNTRYQFTSLAYSQFATGSISVTAAQDTLVSGTNIKTVNDNSLLGSGNINTQEVFVATYGTTTANEILTAISNNLLPIVFYNNILYVYHQYTQVAGDIYFICVDSATNLRYLRVDSSSWKPEGVARLEVVGNKTSDISTNATSTTKYPTTKGVADYAEDKSNKVTSLSAQSTDTQYPSAKAVYDAFGEGRKWGVISQTQTWTGSNATGYDYTMSDLVHGWIPQANIDLFEAAGAVFNETSGYFELNGLEDISYEEMQKIYAHSANLLTRRTDYSYLFYDRINLIRTICPLPPLSSLGNPNFQWAFYNNALEVAPINGYVSSLSQTFRVTSYLRDAGKINLSNIAASSGVSNSFLGSYSLESIQLTGLKFSIEFKASSRLSVASILYMITNEAATSAITITLHATAYTRAIADSDVQAALQAHTNVTLAQAT